MISSLLILDSFFLEDGLFSESSIFIDLFKSNDFLLRLGLKVQSFISKLALSFWNF